MIMKIDKHEIVVTTAFVIAFIMSMAAVVSVESEYLRKHQYSVCVRNTSTGTAMEMQNIIAHCKHLSGYRGEQ